MPLYPGLHLMRDGRLFYSGTNVVRGRGRPAGIWNIGTNTFAPVPGLPDANRRDQGMSVLLPPAQDQKVMIMGGGNHFDPGTPPTASTAIIDLSQPNPSYSRGAVARYAEDLPERRDPSGLHRAPDRRRKLRHRWGQQSDQDRADLPPDHATRGPRSRIRASDASTTPRRCCFPTPPSRPSAASRRWDSYEPRIERFSPPYLRTGTPRPTITSAPSEVHYGAQYPMTTTQASPLRSAVLVRPMAVTHSVGLEPAPRLVAVHDRIDRVDHDADLREHRTAGLVHALRRRPEGRPFGRIVGPPDLVVRR